MFLLEKIMYFVLVVESFMPSLGPQLVILSSTVCILSIVDDRSSPVAQASPSSKNNDFSTIFCVIKHTINDQNK